jgi:hypothetical protein
MILLIAVGALCSAQEDYPVEHHTWLRYKPGTMIRHKTAVEAGGRKFEGTRTWTLKEVGKQDCVVEEVDSMSQDGAPSTFRVTQGTRIGEELVKVKDKETHCEIWIVKSHGKNGALEARYWIPKGKFDPPLRMVQKQEGFEADLLATSLNEKLKVGEREVSCVKLEGKVKAGGSEGSVKFWHTQELPSSHARMEMSLQTPEGPFTLRMEAVEAKELK